MVCCFLAACQSESKTSEKEVLTMATNATFPPYEFYEGDKIVGIDAEIAEAIAGKLDMTLDIQDTEFGSIIAGVQSGKYDMGMAGMTVTEERLQSVNFSTSYATGIQSVIVKEGSDIASIDDIEGHKVGVQQDTTGHIYAADTPENGGYGEDAVIPYKTGAEAVQALVTDKVQCVIIDNEPAKSFVAANEGLKILDATWVEEEYAIAIAKENTDLLEKINGALRELTADGTIPAIIEKYIPTETEEVAEEVVEEAAEEVAEEVAEEAAEEVAEEVAEEATEEVVAEETAEEVVAE
jgi:polar amino acid transport system substrate-binding protein